MPGRIRLVKVIVLALSCWAGVAVLGQESVPQNEAPRAEISTRTTTVSTTTLNPWIWYGTPAAFLLVVVLTLVVYGFVTRKHPDKRKKGGATTDPQKEDEPPAYLVLQGDEQTRYLIDTETWRIGRGGENELTIPDHSVSRQHAEIHRGANGSYTILDLESLNGVYVNEKKVRSKHILEGDVIDLGDISFRFTRKPTGSSQEAPTMLGGRDLPEA
jgi:hypothetical protein